MIQKLFIGLNIFLYRLTGGILGGRSHRSSVLLLTTTGRKTGQSRTTPLRFLRQGDTYMVAASNWGKPQPPAWLLNLQTNPKVTIQDMRQTLPARARIATPDEQARLYPQFIASDARFERYQAGVRRTIAVVLIQPD